MRAYEDTPVRESNIIIEVYFGHLLGTDVQGSGGSGVWGARVERVGMEAV